MKKNNEVIENVKVVEPVEVKSLDNNALAEVKLAVKLEKIKAEINKLSGADKLKLFNWLKSSGSTSKSGAVKNVGVGDFVRERIFEGLSNNEIVDACKEKYGNEQTSYNCVVWYRNKMKK